MVAPNRAVLVAGARETRRALLDRHWDGLVGQAWEDLCRRAVPRLPFGVRKMSVRWNTAQRYWQGNEPEWDIVADGVEASWALVGEARFVPEVAGGVPRVIDGVRIITAREVIAAA